VQFALAVGVIAASGAGQVLTNPEKAREPWNW
jgi:hypothetical protein